MDDLLCEVQCEERPYSYEAEGLAPDERPDFPPPDADFSTGLEWG